MVRRDLITVYRIGRVGDGQGGFRARLAAVATERVRFARKDFTFRDLARSDELVGQRPHSRVAYVGYTRHNADIQKSDRLKNENTGFEVEVLSITRPGQSAMHVEMQCVELQVGN